MTVKDSAAGGAIVPSGSVGFSTSAGGSFSPTECTLSSGSCSATYTAPSVKTQTTITITASYHGDSLHESGTGATTVQVTPHSVSVSLNCNPSNLSPLQSTTCTVIVQDAGPGTKATPTGHVGFTASVAGGVFSPAECTLVAGSCSVSYTAPSVSAQTNIIITATYSGDSVHLGGSKTTNIQVTPRPVSVNITCNPNSLPVLGSTTCTVTVTDTGPGTQVVPTGTVAFSASVGGGTFSSATCTLSAGSCSVNYTPPLVLVPTTITITATYSGDAVHIGGSSHTDIHVT